MLVFVQVFYLILILIFGEGGKSRAAKANKSRMLERLAAKTASAAFAAPPANPQTPPDIGAMEIEGVAASPGA